MAEPVIRLDRSRPFSECRGERTPDDPHYRVTATQGFKVGKTIVQLPFDSNGDLVPDDGKTEPYQGLVEGKPVMHSPLYSPAMRDLVTKLKARAVGGGAAVAESEKENDAGDGLEGNGGSSGDQVNLVAWLRGESKYEWPMLQAACKARYSRMFTSKKQMVVDLVLDEKLVPEDQVCDELKRNLPAAQAA